MTKNGVLVGDNKIIYLETISIDQTHEVYHIFGKNVQ